jgi:signal transduction histidine kinase
MFFVASAPTGGWDAGTLAVACIALTGVYIALVVVALRPIRDLEAVAGRVWRGDYAARVDSSAVADREVLRVGSMFNLLLDGLVADRARMRRLASEIVTTGDRERALLARELHDSTAQRMAALLLQLGSAARDCGDESLKQRLGGIRDEMHDVLEEVTVLSHTVHPRVLDDLGVVAALRHLARETERISSLQLDVVAPESLNVSPLIASVLYRVAQEALRNVVRHARATEGSVVLEADEDGVAIAISDNGRGFDIEEARARREGMGLFTMEERVQLVDGSFRILSSAETGTQVQATIPTTPGAASAANGNPTEKYHEQ